MSALARALLLGALAVCVQSQSNSWTSSPTGAPTTKAPTPLPTTDSPTGSPTESPTVAPSESPTASPTAAPSESPTESPTAAPSMSPTKSPTSAPSMSPTKSPTSAPSTAAPTTADPTATPTAAPTATPTAAPSESPTQSPTASPTFCYVDQCGVCDSNLENDCAKDCSGVWGGTAVFDKCMKCGGNNACADCKGVITAAVGGGDPSMGPNRNDQCGTCDANQANDCREDCALVWGGTTKDDQCGKCGGNNSTCTDCKGTVNGIAQLDKCGVCQTDTNAWCTMDCQGVWGGSGVLDECSKCDAKPKNDWKSGYSTCKDCKGESITAGAVPNTKDECGVCDSNSTNDCTQDCSGAWGGSLSFPVDTTGADCDGMCGGKCEAIVDVTTPLSGSTADFYMTHSVNSQGQDVLTYSTNCAAELTKIQQTNAAVSALAGSCALPQACAGDAAKCTSYFPAGSMWAGDCKACTTRRARRAMRAATLTGGYKVTVSTADPTNTVAKQMSAQGITSFTVVPRDCKGVSNGKAVKDRCDVCAGNNTCVDCANVTNGKSKSDNCGVCDTNSTNNCAQDCRLVWGGSAPLQPDKCGVCQGNNACEDCSGTANGKSVADKCGTCDVNPANNCKEDCNTPGVWGGSAKNDACDKCGGDNSTCADCKGTPYGGYIGDKCGACVANTSLSCVADCAGLWGGSGVRDKCNVCNGNNACVDCNGTVNGRMVLDKCNVCQSNALKFCKQDCAKVWGGTAVLGDSSCPTASPTTSPTSSSPTTVAPTAAPSTRAPTNAGETWTPTASPTATPTATPSESPTESPTAAPTAGPTTSWTSNPTAVPTGAPVTGAPVTGAPVTGAPVTVGPTAGPTTSWTSSPTAVPTGAPVTLSPATTHSPTASPTIPCNNKGYTVCHGDTLTNFEKRCAACPVLYSSVISGDIASFDEQEFKVGVSRAVGTALDRVIIDGKRPGSVVVDWHFNPDEPVFAAPGATAAPTFNVKSVQSAFTALGSTPTLGIYRQVSVSSIDSAVALTKAPTKAPTTTPTKAPTNAPTKAPTGKLIEVADEKIVDKFLFWAAVIGGVTVLAVVVFLLFKFSCAKTEDSKGKGKAEPNCDAENPEVEPMREVVPSPRTKVTEHAPTEAAGQARVPELPAYNLATREPSTRLKAIRMEDLDDNEEYE